jgi:prepilin-type N-terminal cleavage/methylation domain-containing protein
MIPQSVGQQIKNPTSWDTTANMLGASTRLIGKKGFTLIEVLVTIIVSSILFIAIANLMASFFRINADIKNTIAINNEKETVHMTLQNFLDEAWRVIHVENDSPVPGFDKVVLLNKKDSKLLPFTIILADPNEKKYADTAQTDIYNLLIKNVAYTYDGNQWKLSDKMIPKCDATGKTYCVDYWNNAVYKYSTAQNPTDIVNHFCVDTSDTNCISRPTNYCGEIIKNPPNPDVTITTDCILVGYKKNQLVPGTTAFAPFIEITKPTDIKINGTTINILSPYEAREYQIDISGSPTKNSITTSTNTTGLFPYYYDPNNSLQINKDWITLDYLSRYWKLKGYQNKFTESTSTVKLVSPLDSFPATDIRNSFGLLTFKYIKNVYGSVTNTATDTIDQIQYTLVDPMYTKDGTSKNNNPIGDKTKQSSSFLFKTSRIN